jgi:hypothetical protein
MENLTFDGVQYFQPGDDDRTAFGLAHLVDAMLAIVSSIASTTIMLIIVSWIVSSCWNQLASAFSRPAIGKVVRKI